MTEDELAASLATAAVLRHRAESADLRLSLSGRSMGRRYRPGSMAQVSPFEHLPRPGEVWAFVDPGDTLVVHRCVWRLRSGSFRFRGDAERSADPPVLVDLLVGQVVLVHDGDHVWAPRRWHVVEPTIRLLAHGLAVRARRWSARAHRFVKTSFEFIRGCTKFDGDALG